jgi:hypothetical protein
VHTSFSVLGLTLIFALGGLIILMSYSLDPIMGCLRERRGLYEHQQLEWAMNWTLQLQRLAHEQIGMGTWSKATDLIPITDRGEALATLDISSPKHPLLWAYKVTPRDEAVWSPDTEAGSDRSSERIFSPIKSKEIV